MPAGAEGWVLEHFYAEVLAVLRCRFLTEKALTEAQATAAVPDSAAGHSTTPPSRRSSTPPGPTATT